MDPKLSNLDPKLQAAYNRVMGGTNINPAPQQPDQSSQTPQSTQQIPQQQSPSNIPVPPPADPAPGITPPSQFATNPPTNNPAYVNQNPIPNPPPPTQENINQNEAMPAINSSAPIMPSSSSTVAFNAENSSKNIGTTPVKKGGSHHLLPIIVGIGILVLLAAYTFIWIMIFNVEVPFIPKF